MAFASSRRLILLGILLRLVFLVIFLVVFLVLLRVFGFRVLQTDKEMLLIFAMQQQKQKGVRHTPAKKNTRYQRKSEKSQP